MRLRSEDDRRLGKQLIHARKNVRYSFRMPDGKQPREDGKLSFIISEGMSHGSSVAFVGENTVTGPQAVVFSAGDKGTNTSWDDRQLKIGLLVPGAPALVLDATKSHYVVLSGDRKVDDDPNTSD